MFRLLAPAAAGAASALAVRCPACGRVSINLVSREHVDVPFHNDARSASSSTSSATTRRATVDEFQAELYSAAFDARRLHLS